MAPAPASFFLATYYSLVLLFLLPHLATSCSIYNFVCQKSDNSSTIRTCGRSKLRCDNGFVQFQFFGTGQWYRAASIEYPEHTIKIWDTNATLVSRLQSTNCDFFYNFTTPIPGFHPSWIEDLSSNSTFFNCKPDSYDFSRDVFGKLIGPPQCAAYDLHYTNQPQKPPPRDHCTPNETGGVELEFMFEEDANGNVNFSLRSMGFSRLRLLDAQCFSCAITDGYCDAVPSQQQWNNTSCACGGGGGSSSYKCPSKSRVKRNLAIGFSVAAFVLLLTGCVVLLLSRRRFKWLSSSLGKKESIHSNTFAGSLGFFLTACFLGVTLCSYRRHWKMRDLKERAKIGDQTIDAILAPLALRRYKYSEVKRMANYFVVKLGEGGYGSVYKGSLSNGMLVAIKVLHDSKGSGEDFINEIVAIGRTNHINIVSLLGFCFEGSKRCLVYEFMANGSLEKFIFLDSSETVITLDWNQLYKISLGIAKGLEYLHKGCRTQIVHFDIKPHNILLDEDFTPKISDFGLAKLCLAKKSILSNVCARGTIGYIAPEVFSRNFGNVSSKSDVYSFGMMILEMVGRRRNVDPRLQNYSEVYFPHWIYDHFEHDKDLEAYDITRETQEIAKKMIIIGLCCIQTNPTLRPTISRVVEMLEGSSADLHMPPKPYICSPPRSEADLHVKSTSVYTMSTA